MRRFVLRWLLGLLLILGLPCLAFSADSINGVYGGYPIVRLQANGQPVQSDVPAVSFYGRTMVPIRFVAEQLGARVDWDPNTWTASILSKGILGKGDPVWGTPDKGVLYRLTDQQVQEAITYGIGKEGMENYEAFEKYYSMVSEQYRKRVYAALGTEYSSIAFWAHWAANESKEVPTVATAPRSPGYMGASIYIEGQTEAQVKSYVPYVRQGTVIAPAIVEYYSAGQDLSYRHIQVGWYVDGLDLTLPIQVILAKPDGTSYTFSWNLMGLR
ncbi:MAG: copper amine oxidase N-terminal domain-containing protein [Bacillota bacterium]